MEIRRWAQLGNLMDLCKGRENDENEVYKALTEQAEAPSEAFKSRVNETKTKLKQKEKWK